MKAVALGPTLNLVLITSMTICATFVITALNISSNPQSAPSHTPHAEYVPDIKTTPSPDQINQLFAVDSIPQVHITVNPSELNRDTYCQTIVSITDSTIPANTTDSLSGGIRFRGNSTYALATQENAPMPYKIKLDQPQNLLGMGAHKKWHLLTNFIDRSYVKQFISFGLVGAIYGSSYFQPQAKYVEVFLNNEYRGLYLLTESIEEDDGALDIDVKNLADYGDNFPFLLEMDYYTATSDFPSPQPFVLKYPKSLQDITPTEAANIQASIRNLYRSAASQAPTAQLNIDVDSFVKSWVACEIITNPSCYGGPSAYLYRSPGSQQIVAGPLWDFDLAIMGGFARGGFYNDAPTANPLMHSLLKRKDFVNGLTVLYKHIYANILPHAKTAITNLKTNRALKSAVQRAERKYNTWHSTYPQFNGFNSDYFDTAALTIDSYEGHIDYHLDLLFGSNPTNTPDHHLGRIEWIYQNLDKWYNTYNEN